MIDRPKRSITRFFIPLIDVLILLFCIFLLMPFVRENPQATDEQPVPTDVKTLLRDLADAQRELKRLRDSKETSPDRLSECILEVDPATGNLLYYREGERIDVRDARIAQDLIDRHRLKSGSREPYFLLMLPASPKTSALKGNQLDEYRKWFRDVKFKIYDPSARVVP